MNSDESETIPLTLNEFAVYLGLIPVSEIELSDISTKKLIKPTTEIRKRNDKILKSVDFTKIVEPTIVEDVVVESSANESILPKIAVSNVDSFFDDREKNVEDEKDLKKIVVETTNKIILQGLTDYFTEDSEDGKSNLTNDSTSSFYPQNDLEFYDLCIRKLKNINSRLRYLEELKIDDNYTLELNPEIELEKKTLLNESNKISDVVNSLKEKIKDPSIDNVNAFQAEMEKKPEKVEINSSASIPDVKPVGDDWFIKTILQLTRALNQGEKPRENIRANSFSEDHDLFVETLLQLIKLDERARGATSSTSPSELMSKLGSPHLLKTDSDFRIESQINSGTFINEVETRLSSLEQAFQEIEGKPSLMNKINEDVTNLDINSYNLSKMSIGSKLVNERIVDLERKLDVIKFKKAKLGDDLLKINSSIDSLKAGKVSFSYLSYPRRGVLAIGFLMTFLGLLILFPVQPPFLLQYLFGFGLSLTGGAIIIDSIWASFERRRKK